MEVDANLNELNLGASTSKEPTRLGMCEVCAFHDAKYTCPKCEVKTCSLRCNKIHKIEIECDGLRDRTKFVPLNKFSNLDLSSDYRLLEEISRNIEVSRKKFGRRITDVIPHHLFKLRNAANEHKITLKFLPYNFAKHKNNSSHLDFKTNTIMWHIDWIFANSENLKLSDKKIPETHKVSSVITRYLTKQEDAILQEKLQFYQAAGLSGIKLFLKAEQKAGKKFYEIDPTLTLQECLNKKLIIEYPTIHVVLKDHTAIYDIIDSDDESNEMGTDGTVKSGNAVVESILKNADNEESLFKSLKNLLFISEYSDQEISDED